MARRIAAVGTAEAITLLIEAAGRYDSPSDRLAIVRGLNESLKGRRRVDMPGPWPEVHRKLAAAGNPALRAEATALALTFGDRAALAEVRAVLADRSAASPRRQAALADLLRVGDPELAPTLQALLAEPSLRGPALRALAAYDDPKSPEAILKAYTDCTQAEKRDALATLATRTASARVLLAAVASNRIAARDLSAETVRQLRNLKDAGIEAEIARVWGKVNDTPAAKLKQMARYRRMLTAPPAQEPDPSLGRAIFARTCQQCHTLFGVGGKVGPELTGSNRGDLDYVLSNVLDPSALIGKDYQAHVVSTRDGRVLTGIIRAEDPDSITLLSANDSVTIPQGEIEERKLSAQSMMPEDLWNNLSDHEVRSLVAYLARPAQVPMLATAENAASFFNGRDLTLWQGDPNLWRVDNGEIVGKTAGLKRNEFLRSELTAGDFRLTLQVKLVGNQGNSGIQFRSEALPDGEVRGYQADVGPGWWGKLYEENGRGLLWPQSGEAHLKPGEWNTYEVVAVGSAIRTFLNGKPCVRLDDPAGARRGIFAVQLHSGGATEVRFKDLRLELNPKIGSPEPAGR
jgi:putative heme-binding domain-containing protein